MIYVLLHYMHIICTVYVCIIYNQIIGFHHIFKKIFDLFLHHNGEIYKIKTNALGK